MVTLSPEAYSELVRLVAECEEPNPAVFVGWLPAQFDLVRSPEGAAVWTEAMPDQWGVAVMSLDHISATDAKAQIVGNVRIVFVPGESGASHVTLGFANGRFHVR
jgi:hypothetical protein